MRGRLALQHRHPSAVRPGWQGLEPCPEWVTHAWRRPARKHQEASGSAGWCVGARLSHQTRPSMEAVVAQGMQPGRLMPLSPSPSPFKGEGKARPARYPAEPRVSGPFVSALRSIHPYKSALSRY